jgi:hypothetical protein
MKRIYVKPTIDVIQMFNDVNLMSTSDNEPEVTENIGAKENTLIAEDEIKYDENWLWEDN